MYEWTQKPGRKVLTCGSAVLEYFQATARAMTPEEDEKTRLPWLFDAYKLMQVEVHLAEDSPPDAWRLVLHDKCEVLVPGDEEGLPLYDANGLIIHTVSHGECMIIEEGSI